MTITEMRRLGGEKYELLLSDGSKIKTTLSVIADCSLYSGRELGGDELDRVRSASELARAKDRAMYIIGARQHSQRELYDKLVEKGETEQNAAACVEWLIKLHLLDDVSYAENIVRHYSAKGYGRRRIESELYRRKVPKSLWEEALSGLSEEDQDEAVDKLLRSKLKSSEPDRAELKKAADALLRRGFSWEQIKSALSRYNSSLEEDY